MRRILMRTCLLSLGLLMAGCSSGVYKADAVPASIQQIAAQEYHMQLDVKRNGRTLAVHLHQAGVLEQHEAQIGLAHSANEILGNVMEIVHRVALSTDQPIDFYLLLVSDPGVPGVYLTLVRYLDDVRRVNANNIPPTEFFSRTILELKFGTGPVEDFKDATLQDIHLEDFLSWQLGQRIQARLTERLATQGASNVQVGPCVGQFQNGEFTFALNVTPAPGQQVNPAVVQQVFEEATGVIAQVLSGYQFNQFQSIRLIHPASGRNLLLPKTQLELFR